MVIVHLSNKQRRIISAEKGETLNDLFKRFCNEHGYIDADYEFASYPEDDIVSLDMNMNAGRVKEVVLITKSSARRGSVDSCYTTIHESTAPSPILMQKKTIESPVLTKPNKRSAPKPPVGNRGDSPSPDIDIPPPPAFLPSEHDEGSLSKSSQCQSEPRESIHATSDCTEQIVPPAEIAPKIIDSPSNSINCDIYDELASDDNNDLPESLISEIHDNHLAPSIETVNQSEHFVTQNEPMKSSDNIAHTNHSVSHNEPIKTQNNNLNTSEQFATQNEVSHIHHANTVPDQILLDRRPPPPPVEKKSRPKTFHASASVDFELEESSVDPTIEQATEIVAPTDERRASQPIVGTLTKTIGPNASASRHYWEVPKQSKTIEFLSRTLNTVDASPPVPTNDARNGNEPVIIAPKPVQVIVQEEPIEQSDRPTYRPKQAKKLYFTAR